MNKKFISSWKNKLKRLKKKESKTPRARTFKKIFNLFSPEEFANVNDNYRIQVKILQRQSNIIGFLSTICVFLVFLIVTLLPLKEKVPYFLTFMPKDEQISYVEPYKKTVSQQRIEKEYLARNYVKLRETIDLVSDIDRFTSVMYYSTDEIGNQFKSEMSTDNNPNSPYKYAEDNNIVSSVNIVSSSMLSDAQYQVDFIVIQSNQLTKKKIKTTEYIATITFIDPKKTFKGEDHLSNPLGYRVSQYQASIKAEKIQSNLETTNESNKSNNNDNLTTGW